MKQLLLHIGTGKTGTTSIQRALHQAAAHGSLGDICYPSVRGSDHNFLAAVYMPPSHIPREYRSRYQARGPEALERDKDHFRDQLFHSIRENDKVILSAEYLGRFEKEPLHSFRNDLEKVGVDRVLVVAYVRDPASAYLSVVQQALKASSVFRAPEAYRYPFRQVLQTWSEEFPDLVLRPFVKGRLVQGDVVCDFDDIASSFFEADGGLGLATVVANESVSAEGMILLQRYRQLFHPAAEDEFKWDSSRLVQLLQQSMDSVPQTRAALLPSVEQTIVGRHQDDLAWLQRIYGVALREIGTEQPMEFPPAIEPHKGSRYLNDVTTVLASFDDGCLRDLLLYCLKETLDEAKASINQLAKSENEASDREAELERLRDENALARRELQNMLASRSWRWGHRIALILSRPRTLIRSFRRG